MSTTPSDGIDVLVIEDIRTLRFPAVYARTMGEAWQLLFSRPWRQVWFDHDMGLNLNGTNTYPLAVQMERLAHDGNPLPIDKVFVHTANPEGGDRLMAALSGWYDTERVNVTDWLAPESEHNEWVGR